MCERITVFAPYHITRFDRCCVLCERREPRQRTHWHTHKWSSKTRTKYNCRCVKNYGIIRMKMTGISKVHWRISNGSTSVWTLHLEICLFWSCNGHLHLTLLCVKLWTEGFWTFHTVLTAFLFIFLRKTLLLLRLFCLVSRSFCTVFIVKNHKQKQIE